MIIMISSQQYTIWWFNKHWTLAVHGLFRGGQGSKIDHCTKPEIRLLFLLDRLLYLNNFRLCGYDGKMVNLQTKLGRLN